MTKRTVFGAARLAVLAAALGASYALPARASVFYPETFTLANGLKLIVVPNKLSAAVAQMVWYKVGSADEAPGLSGLAHYLEHLMFRGTTQIPAGQFSAMIAAKGGQDNAFTYYDYTAYHEQVAAAELGAIMQMEADRMQNLAIAPAMAEPELGVVLSERQQRTDNSPEGLFYEKTQAALFHNHPYGIPVIGWQNEMEKMDAASAMAFYRQHYAPNNAIVVISGNVDVADVLRLAAGTFGRVESRAIPARRVLGQPDLPAEKTILMQSAEVHQPLLMRRYVVPSFATGGALESAAYDVLSDFLAGGEVGVLYRRLVVDQAKASDVDVSYDGTMRGPASFNISLYPAPGVDVHALESDMDEALAQILASDVTDKTVDEAKQRLIRSATFARDSLMAPGYALGAALTTGGTVAAVETWPETVARVSRADVQKALADLLQNKHVVTGFLTPDPNARDEGAEAPSARHTTSMGGGEIQ